MTDAEAPDIPAGDLAFGIFGIDPPGIVYEGVF